MIYYRSLDTLDVNSLSLAEHAGQGSVERGAFRDRRVPNFDTHRPEPQADVPGRDQPRRRISAEPRRRCWRELRAQQRCGRAIEDVGVARRDGNEVYFVGNPGEGVATTMVVDGPDGAAFATPKPKRQYDGLELSLSRRFSNNWFGSANFTSAGSMATTPAWRTRTRSPRRRPDVSRRRAAAGRQHRAAGHAARTARWDLDELEWDSHGNLDVLGRLATDRPVVAKFYGSYTLPFGTQVGGFVYAGSGTPISTHGRTRPTDPGAGERPRRHGPHADADAAPTCSSRTS